MSFAGGLKSFATIPSTFGLRSSTVFAARTAIAHRGPVPGITTRNFGRGQGDAGGWPSTTGNPSGGGRSNNSSNNVRHNTFGNISKNIGKLKQRVDNLKQAPNKGNKEAAYQIIAKLHNKIKSL